MAQTSSGPWILEAAPFFVVVLMVAHVSALVYWIYRLASDKPPLGRRRTRKDLLISLNDLITPKGLRHMNTERSFLRHHATQIKKAAAAFLCKRLSSLFEVSFPV